MSTPTTPQDGARSREGLILRRLEAMPIGYLAVDREWNFRYVNAEAEMLLGMPRDRLVGGSMWELFPAARGTEFERAYRSALATGDTVVFEEYYPAPLQRWYEVRVAADGDGLGLFFLDITARRAALERAEHDALRNTLVSAVTTEMSSTLDPEQAVALLARLLVPAVADWCLITLVEDNGAPSSPRRLRDAAGWHRDEAAAHTLERYRAGRLPALAKESFLTRAIDITGPVSISENAVARISALLAPGDARDALAELGPESATFVALRGRERTVGVITLFNDPGRPPLTGSELALALAMAAPAGVALDNARLYSQQRQLAEDLQRSLLTAPPEPDHMQVVVRYETAAEVAQVGGDWYDSFLQPDGATVLVIGDVVGHDSAAAAAMGQLRGVMRGIACHTGDGPADVLRGVDKVMATLGMNTTATVVVARVEQSTDERDRGITHVRWSNAGHPPPMAINPDGTVVVLAGIDADLLLGIDPDTDRVESSISLDRGSTVLLYTDGLVERRGQSLDDGLALLRDTLADVADLELNELCDEVLARMLPSRPEDDVALVALRLHRQDRPRPEEAGPVLVPPGIDDEPGVVSQPYTEYGPGAPELDGDPAL